MRGRSLGMVVAALVATAALAVVVASPVGAQDSQQEDNVLRVGWGQDPQTLNPFVGLDEEDYTIWAINWDLPINFSPEDLTPTAGIVEEWEVSDDRKTVTFNLVPDRKWSDGEPITSEDVKYSLETLGEEGDLFAGYTSNVTSIKTPDDETVVIELKQPDARMIGGLFIYVLPEHVWGKQSLEDLSGSYQPELPMVGSGPYIVTEFERGRLIRMERNPNFDGPEPEFDEVQFVKFGTEDAAERALQLGEVEIIAEVQPTTFERLGEQPNVETLRGSSPSYTELAFNMCSEQDCPDAQFNPAVQDKTVRQAIAYAIDRERVNQISALGTSFVGNGILPSFYKSFYEVPEEDYTPQDIELANQMLDDAGWEQSGDGPRTKGDQELSFDLYVRSESQSDIQASKLIAEMADEIGVEFNVQVVSVGKLTELTVRKVDGVPAPEFDTFVWGWGGDPYDPSFLLSLFLTEEIGFSSDSFYSNPEYDRLYKQQLREFDTEARKETIQEMVALTQEDLPYIVLTEDPNLHAYRTDRLANVEPVCDSETGDTFCEQTSYEGLLGLEPADGASSDDGGGGGTVLIVIAAAVILGGGAFLFMRSRRRQGREPLEVEE
ncbi:MAG: ABC transporter substrate-binding protein [Solirubrobacterales bacterium]